MTRFQIQHQQQPNDSTCNQTCLAMLLGVPVAEVIKVFGDGGWDTHDMFTALNRCWFRWDALLFDNLIANGHYLASVPSLNHLGGGHCIVIVKDENGETVYDPNRGGPSKKFYGYPEGESVKWKSELIYVCKNKWGDNWYDGRLPERKSP